MSALTILRAASRDVANERYVEVMEAIDALEGLMESAREAEALYSSRQLLANCDDMRCGRWINKTRAALARCGEPA